MKKQSNLSRLLEIAGSHKYLTYASWVFSAISALIALVPFYYIWKMIKEVLEVAPNFGQAQNLTGNGWMAVLFAVIAVLVYIAGLMCSHLGAFRIATSARPFPFGACPSNGDFPFQCLFFNLARREFSPL